MEKIVALNSIKDDQVFISVYSFKIEKVTLFLDLFFRSIVFR